MNVSRISATAFRGGMAIMCFVMPFILAVEYGSMIGAPFADEYTLTSLTYWTWIVTVCFPVIPYVFAVVAAAVALPALAMVGVVLYIVAFAWQCWVIFYYLLIFIDCEGDIHCADNISSLGVITGPYGGPSIRFFVLFAAIIAMAGAELIMAGVLFFARADLIAATGIELALRTARAFKGTSYEERVSAMAAYGKSLLGEKHDQNYLSTARSRRLKKKPKKRTTL